VSGIHVLAPTAAAEPDSGDPAELRRLAFVQTAGCQRKLVRNNDRAPKAVDPRRKPVGAVGDDATVAQLDRQHAAAATGDSMIVR
jgi:hypothetical protein